MSSIKGPGSSPEMPHSPTSPKGRKSPIERIAKEILNESMAPGTAPRASLRGRVTHPGSPLGVIPPAIRKIRKEERRSTETRMPKDGSHSPKTPPGKSPLGNKEN